MKFKSFCVFLSLMMAGCANFPVEDIYTEKLTTEKRHVDDVDIRVDVSTLTDDIVLVKVCDSGVTISPGIRTQLSCHTWSAPGAEANEPGFGLPVLMFTKVKKVAWRVLENTVSRPIRRWLFIRMKVVML